MKKSRFLLACLIGFLSMGVFSACDSDNDNEPLSDPATAIAGTYVGVGQLEVVGLSGMPLEEYPGMKIVITKSSNEFAILIPYEADGQKFFVDDARLVYQITQSANGDFLLTSTTSPNSRVSVTKSKSLTLYYPYVSLGGESGYALSFTGQKQ